MEILGLIQSDGMFDEKEQEFMEEIIETMGISDCYFKEIQGLLDSYTELYKEISVTVFNQA